MARELKKPSSMKETDIKEDAGPIVIDVTPREPAPKQEPVLTDADRRRMDLANLGEEAEVAVAAPAPAFTLTFGAWFQKQMAAKKVKLSYKEAVEAHCRSIGLGDKATEEEFAAALVHFGL